MNVPLLVGGVGAVVALVGVGALKAVLGVTDPRVGAPPAATPTWYEAPEAQRFMRGARRLALGAGVGVGLQAVALLWLSAG